MNLSETVEAVELKFPPTTIPFATGVSCHMREESTAEKPMTSSRGNDYREPVVFENLVETSEKLDPPCARKRIARAESK